MRNYISDFYLKKKDIENAKKYLEESYKIKSDYYHILFAMAKLRNE